MEKETIAVTGVERRDHDGPALDHVSHMTDDALIEDLPYPLEIIDPAFGQTPDSCPVSHAIRPSPLGS
jgi:hypothetical protein